MSFACGDSNRPLADTLQRTRPTGPWDSSPSNASASTSSAAIPSAGAAPLPGQAYTRTVVRDDAFLRTTNIPATWYGDIASQYTAELYFPAGGTANTSPSLLMVFGPGGSNESAFGNYQALADARDLLLVAVNGYQPIDNSDARSHEYYYVALRLAFDLRTDGTLGVQSPFLLAGFSGGAKMAMAVGEYGGTDAFAGVVAAGCNEDLASYAQGVLYNPSALVLPYVLVNATDDPVVGDATAAVIESMAQSGFTDVLMLTYTGGHVYPPLAVMEEAVDLSVRKP
jgi:hypothetical protein